VLGKWIENQKRLSAEGRELQPPWIAVPYSEPWSFKQGVEEWWLWEVFLPYWRRLSPEDRTDYLRGWPPPQGYWEEYLLDYWLS
jgi:hypothetical protein